MYSNIDWDAITIKNNFLFQETLRNKSLCKQLLERVLHIQVKTIRYMETEKTMKAKLSSKNTRLDVYVEDKDEYAAQGHALSRIEKLRDFYRTVFTSPIAKENGNLQMGDLTENIFLNVKAADKTDDEELAAFLRYVNGQKPDSSFTKKLDEEATRIKNNDDWRLKAMTLDMEIKDMKKRIAKREREKGKQESKIEIAKKLLDDGMDVSKVAKLTNLSVKEVTALA